MYQIHFKVQDLKSRGILSGSSDSNSFHVVDLSHVLDPSFLCLERNQKLGLLRGLSE